VANVVKLFEGGGDDGGNEVHGESDEDESADEDEEEGDFLFFSGRGDADGDGTESLDEVVDTASDEVLVRRHAGK
jgi:hypothetical protein